MLDSRSYVLVLGSGGAIGQSLVRLLEWHGYNVLQIKSRYHWDLRNEDSLSIFKYAACCCCCDHDKNELLTITNGCTIPCDSKVKIAFAWLLAGDTQNLSKLSTFTEQYTRSLHENQIQLNNGAILSHTIPWLHVCTPIPDAKCAPSHSHSSIFSGSPYSGCNHPSHQHHQLPHRST